MSEIREARLVDGLRCEITGPYAEKVTTGMPPAIGGAGSAPSPGWLFRGALASCTATVIAMRAAKLGVALKVLEVTLETDCDHRGMLGLDGKVSAGCASSRRGAMRARRSAARCAMPPAVVEVELVQG